MNTKTLTFLIGMMVGGGAGADELSSAGPETPAQAQARQFGMFFGGTATQFDVCVEKGFLSKSDRPAEEAARAYLEKAPLSTQGADLSAFMQNGWDTIKKEILAHEEFYTKDKCASVGKEWAKILRTMKK